MMIHPIINLRRPPSNRLPSKGQSSYLVMVLLSLMFSLLLSNNGIVHAAGTTSCFDGTAPFVQPQWQYCQEIVKGSIFMYYSSPNTEKEDSDGNLLLGFHAANHDTTADDGGGWSALAFGGNGGMKGASQIVVRKVDDSTWMAEDRHSNDYVTPTLDEEQNVQLLFANHTTTHTWWGIMVMINSCDVEHDYVLTDNVSRWMHWALGSTHDFTYHGDQRGQFHANLFASPPIENLNESIALEEEYDILDITMPNVPVVLGEGGKDPTNPYICTIFDLAEMITYDVTQKFHAVRLSAIVDEASAPYVHHMLLYLCPNNDLAEIGGYEHLRVIDQCESMPRGCDQVNFAWAVGGQDIILPDNVGIPFGGVEGGEAGGSGAGGGNSVWAALQMHYYNPNLDENIVDNSGLRAYLTPNVRPLDAGFMELNGGTNNGQRPSLPAGQDKISLPPMIVPGLDDCTGLWNKDEKIHLISAVHHMHLVGSKMEITVQRKSEGSEMRSLGAIREEHHYDFNHQSFEPSRIDHLLSGDQLTLQCEYDTSTRAEPTRFGDLSQQEMCYALLLYYPRQPQMESFYYFSLPESIFNFCTTAGEGPFGEVSQCAELWVSNMPMFYGIAESEGNFAAREFCNGKSGSEWLRTFVPEACPYCYLDQSCTHIDMAIIAQEVHCPIRCDEYDLSVFPDMSRADAEGATGVGCSGDDDGGFSGYFPTPELISPPECVVQGNLSKAVEFELLVDDDSSSSTPMASPSPTASAGDASLRFFAHHDSISFFASLVVIGILMIREFL